MSKQTRVSRVAVEVVSTHFGSDLPGRSPEPYTTFEIGLSPEERWFVDE